MDLLVIFEIIWILAGKMMMGGGSPVPYEIAENKAWEEEAIVSSDSTTCLVQLTGKNPRSVFGDAANHVRDAVTDDTF